jgi:hypothetical protein
VDLRAGLDGLEKRKFLTLPELVHCSRYTDYATPASIREEFKIEVKE